MRTYWVYIMSSRSRVLYIGITSDLPRRVYDHRRKAVRGFSAKYNTQQLVYFEQFDDSMTAITREKQLKGWLRRKKVALIESSNPEWRDLFDLLAG